MNLKSCPNREQGCIADRSLSESLLAGRNGCDERYVQQETRTRMAVSGRVQGPSSDPVEIKGL